jgi:DNA-binding MarR family transcriptional regulator
MDIDELDLKILKAIYVKSNQDYIQPKLLIKEVGITEQRLGDKLDILEKNYFVKNEWGSGSSQTLQNGIYNVKLTSEGRELLRKHKKIPK